MKKYQYIYIVMLYICYNIYAFKCHTHLNSTELIQISTGGMMVDIKGAIPFTQRFTVDLYPCRFRKGIRKGR